MIGFGCVVSSEEEFGSFAAPGIERARAEGDELVVRRDQRCIYEAYNGILDELTKHPNLEAVVLIHQDVQIVDERFSEKVLAAVAEPETGVVGVIGGVGVRSIAWWECEQAVGAVEWDWLVGEEERRGLFDPSEFMLLTPSKTGEVDSVDGLMLVLSARGARELRFDEGLGPGFHGYDADICFQARAAGMKVRVADIKVIHHHEIKAMTEREDWVETQIRFARKWGL